MEQSVVVVSSGLAEPTGDGEGFVLGYDTGASPLDGCGGNGGWGAGGSGCPGLKLRLCGRWSGAVNMLAAMVGHEFPCWMMRLGGNVAVLGLAALNFHTMQVYGQVEDRSLQLKGH
jgi:hypothetical protein